jgi:membrane-associated PAP2 superfamily phosphatase
MSPTLAERRRRDLLFVLALLAALLLWDSSGLDMVLARHYGDAAGFALREHWWLRRVLHDGGRIASGLALVGCALWAWRGNAAAMTRRLRGAWFGVVLLCLVAVPAIKRLSTTSCPWDLGIFGGVAAYVPHWAFTGLDGGPGHCFPSGHAVAAFAFLPLYFQWRGTHGRRANVLLAITLAAGALFGWAQMARGAHFASHTLWSAWCCWTIAVLASRWIGEHPAAASADAVPAAL